MRAVPTWKSQIPSRASGWVTRRRLLDRLHRAAHLPVTLIVAPAGYGKSTLLTEFADESPYSLAWLSLDDSDRDWITFVEDVVAALSMVKKSLGQRTLSASHHAAQNNRATLSVISTLVGELADHPDFVGLVLDDWQRVDGSAEVRGMAQVLLDRLPANVHVFLSCRVRPNLDFTRRVAARELSTLGWDDLAFTADEAVQLLSGRASLTVEAIRSLADTAEGWVMGMLLAAESGTIPALRAVRNSDTPLADYLTRAVFEELLPRQQDLLLVASLLEPIDPSTCDRLLERHDSARLLRELEERRLVTPDGRNWRLHHLLGSHLRDRLEATSPRRYRELRIRLAQHAVDAGDIPAAVEQLLACDDYEAVITLLEQHGESIGNTGRWRSITEWLLNLPDHAVSRSPALLSLWARAAIRLGDPQRGLALAARALDVARLRGDGPGALWARLIYAHALFSVGRAETAVHLCQEALGSEYVANAPAVAAEAHRTLGVALIQLGHFADALEHMNEALRLFDRDGDLPNVAYSLNAAGTCCNSLGRPDQAIANYRKAMALRGQLGDAAGEAVIGNNLARIQLLRGQYDEAVDFLTRTIATDERLSDRRGLAAHLSNLGDAYRTVGAATRATACYQRALEACRETHYTIGIVDALDGLANLARVDNRLSEAEAHAREAQGEAEAAGSLYLQGICELTLGATARDAGSNGGALAHFDRAAELLTQAGQRDGQARAAFGAALTYFRAGQDREALSALRRAILIAEGLGTTAFLLHDLRPDMTDARARLEIDGSSPADALAVRELLTSARAEWGPLGPLVHLGEELALLEQARQRWGQDETSKATTHTLRIQAFGDGLVVVDGREIGPSDWARSKARELFFALATSAIGVPRAELLLDIWPDTPEPQVQAQWRSALYGARCTIGADWIVEQHGRYQLLQDGSHELICDVREFETAIARGHAADGESRATFYQQAAELASDRFLTSSPLEWAHDRRMRLDGAYEDCLVWLAHWAEDSGWFPEAITYAHRLLERDDDQAELHELIIRCHLASHEPLLAVRHYRNYIRRARYRGLEPTTELVRLHKQVLTRI